MKKTFGIIMILCIIISAFYGCAKTNGEEGREVIPTKGRVFIGDGYLDETASLRMDNAESISRKNNEFDLQREKLENELKGTAKTLSVLGTEYNTVCGSVHKWRNTRDFNIEYFDKFSNSFSFDKNGEFIGFLMNRMYDDYKKRTVNIEFDEAKEIFLEFIGEYINVNEFMFTDEEKRYTSSGDDAPYQFLFSMEKYVTDIIVRFVVVDMDQYGNIYSFLMSPPGMTEGLGIELPDETAVRSAVRERLDDYYIDQEGERLIDSIDITRKRLVYLDYLGIWAVEMKGVFTAVNSEGNGKVYSNQFYYLLE